MRRLIYFTVSFILGGFSIAAIAQEKYSLNSDNSEITWEIKPQDDLSTKTGNQISTPGFDNTGYIKGVVPGTVFTAYVDAGIVPNPDYGDNIYNVDETFYDRPFWYRAEFDLPASYSDGKRVWLHFDGINRYAAFFFNGTRISVAASSNKDVSGHMIRSEYDVTQLINKTGKNAVAVLITDADQRKIRDDQSWWGGNIFSMWASPTYMSAAGWDWMPYIPGRLAGITGNAYLLITGDAVMEDPWIRTALPTNEQAEVSINTDIKNAASESKEVTLSGTINPGNIQFAKNITVPAKSTSNLAIDKNDFSQLIINNPNLWWPNGYGDPNLYTCELTCTVDGVVSDVKAITFGIKKYDYQLVNNSQNKQVLTVFVNGQKIFIKGGDWGISEYLLRCHGKEYETKILLHKDMNYNMIRLWTGCVTDDEFYDYCDKYGIMVWDDFWFLNGIGDPDNTGQYEANAADKVKRLRNHPCIAVWCGANERYPDEPFNSYQQNLIATEDGNDRRYVGCSNCAEEGLSGSGWWGNATPTDHFNSSNSNLSNYPYGSSYGYGMRTEIGTATFPAFESVKEFIPESDWWPLPTSSVLQNEDNTVWNHHFFGKEASNASPDNYRNTVNSEFGASSGLEEFCEKAQLLNLEVMRGMYEAWNDKMWSDASGILIWMSNPAFPAFVWQTYDYYYDATGAYWGAKKACEPVHIQWNSSSSSGSFPIKVINATNREYDNLTAKAFIYQPNGTEVTLYHKEAAIDAKANQATTCFNLFTSTASLPAVHFLKLVLTDASGNTVSENWYLKGTTMYNYTALKNIPKANLSVSVAGNGENGCVTVENGKCVANVTITNAADSPSLAYGVRLRVVDSTTGDRILPIFLPDNYLLILPGETKEIPITFDADLLKGEGIQVGVKQFLQPEEFFSACVDSSETGIQVVKKDVTSNVKIYPNPTTGILNIECQAKIDEVSVFNILGNKVYTGIGNKVDIGNLPDGIYFVNMKINNQVVTKRILKK